MLRFDPFHDLDRLSHELLAATTGTPRAPRFMPVDLYRLGEHYVLHADLPGVDPGSVDLQVDGGRLTITAERTPASLDDAQWLASERSAGRFQRHLTLGEGIDVERISATYENGVLTVTIPVAEKAKPRRIEITPRRDADEPRVIESADA